MIGMPMKRLGPFGILFASVLILAALQLDYAAAGKAPSDNVAHMSSWTLALALILWIMADAQMRRQTPCYDFGFLVAVFFPVSLVWYVFWSRGWRGFLLLGALLGLILLPSLATVAAWVLRSGFA
jgi:hypothetical protein